LDSLHNLNRIEWEARQEGNLNIFLNLDVINSSTNKIKLFIDYKLEDNSIGAIFQSFYDEKNDTEYDIVCYTPNFYFNTCNWVPCVYDLKSQIQWRKYIIVDNQYSVYSSCLLSGVYQDPVKNKKAYS